MEKGLLRIGHGVCVAKRAWEIFRTIKYMERSEKLRIDVRFPLNVSLSIDMRPRVHAIMHSKSSE